MTQKQSLLIVSHFAKPHVGGIEQVAEKQAIFFSKNDFEVTHIATTSVGEKKGVEKREKNFKLVRLSAYTFFEKKLNIPFPILKIQSIFKIWNFVKKADIVHIHDVFYQICWVVALFAKMQNKQVFLTQHVAVVKHDNGFVVGVQKFVYETFGFFIFSLARKIIVYNKNVYDFLLESGVDEQKIMKIKNGIDLELFNPVGSDNEKNILREKYGIVGDKPILLFVGRLVSKKGFDIVYDMKDKDYEIVFVGDGSVSSSWKNKKGVHFLGSRDEKELSEIYKMSDVFVFPAQGEVFTLTIQEAMASGLPVVVTKDDAYNEFEIKNDEVIFVDLNTTSFKKAVKKILSDDKFKKEISLSALKFAKENFDWEKNIEKVFELYKKNNDKKIFVTTSWDDGHVLDLKLAKLLEKYDIKGTFYIPIKNNELSFEERLKEVDVKRLSEKFEIGAHTVSHWYLTDLSDDVAKKEIFESKKELENLLNKDVSSFCYPAGKYKKVHKKMVSDVGFRLARTVRRFIFKRSHDAYELGTSVHTYDHFSDVFRLFVFVRFNPVRFFALYRSWDKQAMAMFDMVKKRGGVFHLWGHSWELEEHNDWGRLEKVLSYISNHADVSYVANKELYE